MATLLRPDGYCYALREKRSIVPDTPATHAGLIAEVGPLCKQLNVPNVFYGLSAGMQVAGAIGKKDTRSYILLLDSEKMETPAKAYASNEQADEEYLEFEKQTSIMPTSRLC